MCVARIIIGEINPRCCSNVRENITELEIVGVVQNVCSTHSRLIVRLMTVSYFSHHLSRLSTTLK